MASKKDSGFRIQKRETRQMSCKLTNEELIERGHSLAETIENTASEEAKQESTKREMKARLAQLEAERSRLTSIVTRRSELRDVECEIQMHDDSLRVLTVRLDTGEVVHERAMNDAERQTEIPV